MGSGEISERCMWLLRDVVMYNDGDEGRVDDEPE